MKYVLQNILKFGKANPGAIAGKVFSEDPSLKKKKDLVFKTITATIKEVNKWNKTKQQQEFSVYASTIPEKKKVTTKSKEFKELPELEKIKGNYTFRIEIAPSGMLHIGHIIMILINAEYAKKYKGKFILRISDTNPENVDPAAYHSIVEDTKWITNDAVNEVVVQSYKMDIYYMYAKQLIEMKKAYVCFCNTEFYREKLNKKEACPCRETTVDRNLEEWHKMFTEYQPGETVLRLKGDLQHKNPAARDWPAFRINDTKHPRQGKKYRVWPLMNFSVAVDDYENGITHVIRGKDHVVNKERQAYLFKYFGWQTPHYIHMGRINFSDMKIKTSLTKEDIKNKKYSGWDDIRLPFIGAFRKRGMLPAAFMKYVHEIGPSKVDKTVTFETFMQSIYSYNKEFVDAYAKRYFFVEKPKQITIKDAPNLQVKAPLHPDSPKKGSRNFTTGKDFYIADTLERNKLYRFMHLFNFKNKTFAGEAYDAQLKATPLHWLPVEDDLVTVWVTMPDGKTLKGVGEKTLEKVKVHDIIQFERVGFCRLDEKTSNKLVFCYGHR